MVLTGKCNHIQCRPIGSKFEVVWQYYHVKHAHIHTPPFPLHPHAPHPQQITMLLHHNILCLVYPVCQERNEYGAHQ